MARYVLVVHSNPVAGREAEYHDWYDHRHLDDVRRLPGVVAARRYDLAEVQLGEVPQVHRHLAIYDVDIDDIQRFIAAMGVTANSAQMPISTALGPDKIAVLWRARGD
jgi:hypothetical protein